MHSAGQEPVKSPRNPQTPYSPREVLERAKSRDQLVHDLEKIYVKFTAYKIQCLNSYFDKLERETQGLIKQQYGLSIEKVLASRVYEERIGYLRQELQQKTQEAENNLENFKRIINESFSDSYKIASILKLDWDFVRSKFLPYFLDVLVVQNSDLSINLARILIGESLLKPDGFVSLQNIKFRRVSHKTKKHIANLDLRELAQEASRVNLDQLVHDLKEVCDQFTKRKIQLYKVHFNERQKKVQNRLLELGFSAEKVLASHAYKKKISNFREKLQQTIQEAENNLENFKRIINGSFFGDPELDLKEILQVDKDFTKSEYLLKFLDTLIAGNDVVFSNAIRSALLIKAALKNPKCSELFKNLDHFRISDHGKEFIHKIMLHRERRREKFFRNALIRKLPEISEDLEGVSLESVGDSLNSLQL